VEKAADIGPNYTPNSPGEHNLIRVVSSSS
jgi:hypothetical protein